MQGEELEAPLEKWGVPVSLGLGSGVGARAAVAVCERAVGGEVWKEYSWSNFCHETE